MSNKPVGTLHVFAQFTHHADALIAGNKAGLELLADAIAHAIKYGARRSAPVFVNDGEGYEVEVRRVDESEVDNLGAPYYSTYISEEVSRWQTRAFKAEAELSRLRRAAATGEKVDGNG